MSNNAQNSILDSGTGGVTLNTDNTIQGAGQILLDINNTGTIDANAASTLTVDADSTSTNTGIMQASSGGTLKLNTGNYTNTGGTIQALDGSLVELSGASITDGILHTAGTGVIRNVNSATLEDVTLNSLFEQNTNTTTSLKNSFTNNGSYTMNSVGHLTNLVMTGASDVTLGGTGTVTMSDNAQNRIYSDAGQRLTNEANHTIEGAGQIGVNQTLLTNKGTINANQSSGLTIDLTNTAGSAVNDGTLKASNGGKLIIASGSDFSGTGNWDADGGTIQLNSGVNVTTTGNIDVQNGGSLALTNANMTGNNLNVTGSGSSISVNSGIELAGNFLYDITDEADSVWGVSSSLQMNGFDSFLEVGGFDTGIDPVIHNGDPVGFVNNFHLENLLIGSGAKVHMADFFNNGNQGGTYAFAEALYVDTLTIIGTGLFNLNGLNLYYNTLIGDISQIIDEA
ncbi:MAG: hypothetical protein GY727_06225, partial [Gammaproteobacteria bacterium]|nr:hypothetical protein [Gammaproteobacteria bacterium]